VKLQDGRAGVPRLSKRGKDPLPVDRPPAGDKVVVVLSPVVVNMQVGEPIAEAADGGGDDPAPRDLCEVEVPEVEADPDPLWRPIEGPQRAWGVLQGEGYARLLGQAHEPADRREVRRRRDVLQAEGAGMKDEGPRPDRFGEGDLPFQAVWVPEPERPPGVDGGKRRVLRRAPKPIKVLCPRLTPLRGPDLNPERRGSDAARRLDDLGPGDGPGRPLPEVGVEARTQKDGGRTAARAQDGIRSLFSRKVTPIAESSARTGS